MHRRTFLTTGLGSVGTVVAGCITVGEEPSEHLSWSTSLDARPGPTDSRDLAYADGTVAAVSANRLFGVSRTGEFRWETFDHASGVFGVEGGFLGVDWPDYHPRNAVNDAEVKKVSPAGETRWKSIGRGLLDLAVGSDRFVTLRERSSEPVVTANSLADGAEQWTAPLERSATDVRLSGGTVVAVGDDVVAYDLESGERVWEAAGFDRHSPPVVDGDRLYFTRHEEPYRVRVVDAGDGHRVTEYDVGSGLVPNSPLVVNDGVGIGTGYDDGEQQCFAVDPRRGDVRWWTSPEKDLVLSPRSADAFAGDTVFLFDIGSVLQAIDLNDGSVGWSFDAEKNYPVVVARGNTVYVLAGGTLHALDPSVDG